MLFVAVAGAMLVGYGAAILPVAAAADKTVWDGVFTSAQATRGGAVYATECSGCHRDGLPERARPAADGVCVIGVPHDTVGELVSACTVPATGAVVSGDEIEHSPATRRPATTFQTSLASAIPRR